MITLTAPWWALLIWGIILIELGRCAGWTGDIAGRAIYSWIQQRRENKP